MKKTMKYVPFWEVIYFQAYERFKHRDCQLTVLKHILRFVMNLLNCKKLQIGREQIAAHISACFSAELINHQVTNYRNCK